MSNNALFAFVVPNGLMGLTPVPPASPATAAVPAITSSTIIAGLANLYFYIIIAAIILVVIIIIIVIVVCVVRRNRDGNEAPAPKSSYRAANMNDSELSEVASSRAEPLKRGSATLNSDEMREVQSTREFRAPPPAGGLPPPPGAPYKQASLGRKDLEVEYIEEISQSDDDM